MINRRKLVNITALIAITSIIAGILFLERAEKARLYEERRSFTLSQLSSTRAKLEGIINSTLLLTRGVVAHVATHPDISALEFHMLAKELLPLNPHILNIGLAKDNIITHMYPLKGNEAAIGLRYLDNPKQRAAVLRVIESKKTVVAGPVNLVQGGLGFISRTPVFRTPPEGEPGSGEYWGIASMVINMDSLFEEAGLSADLSSELRIAVRGKNGLGDNGDLFFGDEIVFKSDPILLDVTLPEGSWQLAAIPAKGWSSSSYSIFLLRISGLLISIMIGTLIWMFGRLSDEIVRRKIEEVSAESDRKIKTKFEKLISTTPAVTYSCSIENNKIMPIFASSNIEDYFGYKEKDVIGNTEWWSNNIYPADKELIINVFSEALFHSSKESFIHEYRFKNKKGAYTWIRDVVNILRNEKKAPINIVGSWIDITDLKLAETALKKSEERFALAMQGANDGLWDWDLRTNEVYFSPRWKTMLGYAESELENTFETWERLVQPEDLLKAKLHIEDCLTGKEPKFKVEFRMRHKEGHWVYILSRAYTVRNQADGKPIRLIGTHVDITERKKMEEEITKSQKLESIGLLAGGIAHDFNNILTIILNGMSYVDKYGKLEGKALKGLEDTKNVVNHGKGLTQQLLTFSKGGEPIKKLASVSLLLKDSTNVFLSGSNVKCDISIQNDLWPAEVDKGQIGQVINNLIMNAEQAMPNGGLLEIEGKNVELKTDRIVPLPEGKYLKISIRDHGVGVARENVQKIFDPYFTTKKDGTGLGLAASYSIIKKHGGYINVDSEVGLGATFSIYLPASDKELVIEEKTIKKSGGRQKFKVLLLEDEKRLGKIVINLLKDFNFDADLALDGSEAIELFKAAWNSKQPFDAVVMDLTIPGGMGGKEAINGLIEIDSAVKAIVTSGYSNDPVMANFKDYGFSGVIPKPYDVEDLSEKLTEILSTSDK